MKRYILRLLLTAAAFYFLFLHINGVEFHGTFWHALTAGLLFTVLGSLVEFAGVAISAILTITTFGLALLILVPTWLIGFWIVPAIVLRLLADFMPHTLAFSGWWPAIQGGLIMLVLGIFTSGDTHKKVRRGD